MPRLEVCEMRSGAGNWRRIGITEVLDTPKARRGVLRCPACHGPLRAHGAYAANAPRPHFDHLKAHRGCPRTQAYEGRPQPHPDALR